MALALCDAAKMAGADAVKFQTFITEKLLAGVVATADYQQSNTGCSSQYEMIKDLELGFDDFRRIKAHCDQIDIRFLSTPDDLESLTFLLAIGVDLIKIGSAEVDNIPYLRKIGATRVNVILSTGMATLTEVERACRELSGAGAASITLLHCTTNYPCAAENVNLRAMLTLRDELHLPVGFSDHTQGHLVTIAAVAMGAEIIEKHFTLDNTLPGPDHIASLNPDAFKEMVVAVRQIEEALGRGKKEPQQSELGVMNQVRRKIVAQHFIKKGEVFSYDNLTTKRAQAGIPAGRWDQVIGRISTRDYQADEGIDVLL
jgi:N-acetylneuraminate synthase/N,N'-diacetyllegionaminate synthase